MAVNAISLKIVTNTEEINDTKLIIGALHHFQMYFRKGKLRFRNGQS